MAWCHSKNNSNTEQQNDRKVGTYMKLNVVVCADTIYNAHTDEGLDAGWRISDMVKLIPLAVPAFLERWHGGRSIRQPLATSFIMPKLPWDQDPSTQLSGVGVG
jgi:hypothetical protein